MPTRVFEIKKKDIITQVLVSNDWWTLKPWQHNGGVQPYFTKFDEMSESKKVQFHYWYIGPFAIVSGKWVENE